VKISTAYIANLVSSHLFFCFSGEKKMRFLKPSQPLLEHLRTKTTHTFMVECHRLN
jgi:hypothetical protein